MRSLTPKPNNNKPEFLLFVHSTLLSQRLSAATDVPGCVTRYVHPLWPFSSYSTNLTLSFRPTYLSSSNHLCPFSPLMGVGHRFTVIMFHGPCFGPCEFYLILFLPHLQRLTLLSEWAMTSRSNSQPLSRLHPIDAECHDKCEVLIRPSSKVLVK